MVNPKHTLIFTLLAAMSVGFASLASAQSSSGGSASSSSSSSPSGVVSDDVLSKSLIKDYDGDGTIEIDAFGDSITRGSGDTIPVGEENAEFPATNGKYGYPFRMETYLGLPVDNKGVSGEVISRAGLPRFVTALKSSTPDLILVEGGANDANEGVSPTEYTAALQTMINAAGIYGVQVVLHTTPPTCCDHNNLTSIVEGFVSIMRTLGAINGLAVADTHQGFVNTCGAGDECYLLNLPEGLHPNIAGYDVMGEVATATLLNINLLAAEGAAEFEKALNLPAGTVKTKPTPAAAS